MIRIGLLSHSPHLQGAEKMLLNLAKGLKECGKIEPILLIPAPETGPLWELARKNGIFCEKLAEIPWYVFVSGKLADRVAYYNKVDNSALEYTNVIQKAKLDILLINTLTCAAGSLAAMKENMPYIVWVHGILDAFSVLGEAAPTRYINDQMLLSNANDIIACSRWTANYYEKIHEKNKINVIQNWTKINSINTEVQIKKSKFIFICLSSLEHIKGIDSLLYATSILKNRNANFRVNLYGSGGDDVKFKNLASSLGLQNYVVFNGKVDDVNPVYSSANCVVMPSYIESFSMVSLEAMAHGKTVIASRSGGPQEYIVDGYNGILFEPGNSDELAEKMEWAIRNPEELNRIGQNAYLCAKENFDGKKSIAKFIEIIENAYVNFQGYSRQNSFLSKLYDEILILSKKEEKNDLLFEEQKIINILSGENFEIRPLSQVLLNSTISLKNRKQYFTEVLVPGCGWNGVGLQACVTGGECCGVLSLDIYHMNHNAIALRSLNININSLIGGKKLIIKFPEINASNNQKFRIRLQMKYLNQSGKLCVLQAHQAGTRKIKSLLACFLTYDAKICYELFFKD